MREGILTKVDFCFGAVIFSFVSDEAVVVGAGATSEDGETVVGAIDGEC